MPTIIASTHLDIINCLSCGGIYAIQKEFHDQCREDGQSTWTCPYCKKSWSYRGNSANAQLQNQLKAAEAEKARLLEAVQEQRKRKESAQAEASYFRKSRDGMKGVVAKIKKRVAHGVCPCCNRQFKDLQRHMESKHPEMLKPQ